MPVRGMLGGAVISIVALAVLALVLVLALSSIYRARCDGGRPQYFLVVPTQAVPPGCVGAVNGFQVLRNSLRG
jgi:hypothetical protein